MTAYRPNPTDACPRCGHDGIDAHDQRTSPPACYSCGCGHPAIDADRMYPDDLVRAVGSLDVATGFELGCLDIDELERLERSELIAALRARYSACASHDARRDDCPDCLELPDLSAEDIDPIDPANDDGAERRDARILSTCPDHRTTGRDDDCPACLDRYDYELAAGYIPRPAADDGPVWPTLATLSRMVAAWRRWHIDAHRLELPALDAGQSERTEAAAVWSAYLQRADAARRYADDPTAASTIDPYRGQLAAQYDASAEWYELAIGRWSVTRPQLYHQPRGRWHR